MRIDIPRVRTTGRHIGRLGADADAYTRSARGSLRQAVASGDGFSAIERLREVLDVLGRRLDGLIADTGTTARDIATAARAHSTAEERGRRSMEALNRRLPTTGESLSLAGAEATGTSTSTHNPLRVALTSAGQALGPPQNSPLGPWGTTSWAAGQGLGRFGNMASWMSTAHYGRFAPRAANGRFISPSTMSAWQRGLAGAKGQFVATPQSSGARAAWLRAGRWAGRAGTGLSAVTGAAGQAVADWDNPNLTGDQRVGRAGWRGALEGGGALGGGLAGAKIGAGVGTLVAPGVGTVVGGAIGGLVGGVALSQAGSRLADHTVDAAGDVLESITPW